MMRHTVALQVLLLGGELILWPHRDKLMGGLS